MASEIMVNVYMGHVLGENTLGWTKTVVTNVVFLDMVFLNINHVKYYENNSQYFAYYGRPKHKEALVKETTCLISYYVYIRKKDIYNNLLKHSNLYN
jgi:hypothetical protein